MNEAEWLECTEPLAMLGGPQAKASDRKWRLFVVACCRHVWDQLSHAIQEAVGISERLADGQSDPADRDRMLMGWHPGIGKWLTSKLLSAWELRQVLWETSGLGPRRKERQFQATLLRCILGNPFHPVMLDSTCRTVAVISLATAAYEERDLPSGHLDPTRLAVLADALEDAGCDDQAILDHLRGPGPHVRGCWVVDLLLAKE
jgi:hypothetical protein